MLQKLEDAEKLKQEGNELYAQGDIDRALVRPQGLLCIRSRWPFYAVVNDV